MSANDLLKLLLLLLLLLFTCFIQLSMGARKLGELVQDHTQLMHYHNGPLLTGKISVNLIWYGKFKPSQRAIISDFVASLSSAAEPESQNQPSVAAWWKQIDRYYRISGSKKGSTAPPLSLSLGTQVLDESYSLGKSLADGELATLASRGQQRDAINVVLTASDVSVDRFCTSRCGSHGSAAGMVRAMRGYSMFAYVWVGDSAAQCPGQCAWPFHQPIYGPQSPPLVSPNDDVGLDGMVINLAALLAGTATNPVKTGFFQGPRDAPLEVASACAGVYAKGADPGYAGDLLVEPTTGASYNANGVNGRKYLLPALYDPATSSCSTLL